MAYTFGDITVATSSEDRLVFPESGVTKGDVIAYYHDVGELILRELRGRALTVERFNKGIAGGGYYQKHAPKYFPSWIRRTEVPAKKPILHAVCDTAAALVYIANQNALTFHVPTARADDEGCPDRIVFDLDPPPGRFDLVRRAAYILRELLDGLELPTFLKTTGSKGLHIVVPLDRSSDYRAVYRFCAASADLLCARHPELLTREFYKKDRAGRLLLDIGRNHGGATAVAAYSIRSGANAPVSVPITWSELDDPELRADGVEIGQVRARLDRVGDLWDSFEARSCSLDAARERLEALDSRIV